MGFIYKITSSHEKRVYVGKSTTTPTRRFDKHKRDYKAWLNGKQNYITSYELIKHDDCIMTVLEYDIPDDLLTEREGHWHKQFDCVNKQVPNRNQKEWYQDNRDEILEHQKQYYKDNRDEMLEHQKQYYKDNRDEMLEYQNQYRINNQEKAKQYRINNKDKAKQYRINNKDKAKQYQNQYREDNKQKISKHLLEKLTCECGCVIARVSMYNHKKTKKHKQIMLNPSTNQIAF